MFGNKIKLPDSVYELVKQAAEISGASSVEEFVEGVLEREAQQIIMNAGKGEISKDQIEDIANKLKGLGYLE